MITFSKVKDIIIEKKERVLKVLQYGAKTGFESMPFGIDSSPIKDMTAIYSETSNNSESVIIGYINKNQISQPGETRLFSLDENGTIKATVYLRNDGSIELNGNTQTAVRYAPLNTALQSEKNFINVELAKIAASISSLGGVYTVAPISIDISQSENTTVKMS